MDAAAARQVKRPRTSTPSKGDTKKKNKATKKQKKVKVKGRSNSLEPGNGGSNSNKTSRESDTASAQGQMMAQMLSTFSKVEQSRFEAFQRARLDLRHVEEWVASCLSERWNLSHSRPLSDLVAVGQAPEITLVVSILAKIYAQRVVQTAVKLRDQHLEQQKQQQQQQQEEQKQQQLREDGITTTSSSQSTPLTVEWLRQAWLERQREGLDPGFFLQPASERLDRGSRLLTRHAQQAYQQRRLAALEAQDQYDAWVARQQAQSNEPGGDDKSNDAEKGRGSPKEKEEEKDDNMEVDTPET